MSRRAGPSRSGRQRGSGRGRGESTLRGSSGSQGAFAIVSCFPNIAAHVATVGVRRPDYGAAGRPLGVYTNNYQVDIPPKLMIRHYDDISHRDISSDRKLPQSLNLVLIKKLQSEIAPDIFTPRAVYDGQKNLFSSHELPLEADKQSFDVPDPNRSERKYSITINKVAEIDPDVLRHFVRGQQSHGSNVTTAIMALNVVVRMEPHSRYPFNVRSFFTDSETKAIGNGIVLWRGYFQSIRPGIGRMLINIDISTGMMYKPGPLIGLALEFLGRPDPHPNHLAPVHHGGIPEQERLRLQRFLLNVKFTTAHANGGRPPMPRVIKKLSTRGADAISFTIRGKLEAEDQTLTVAEFFRNKLNRALQYPTILCVELASGAMIPFELCNVVEGQIMKRAVPTEKTAEFVKFSAKKPSERFESISNGLEVLAYGQSEYVRSFGLNVETTGKLKGSLPIQARVLNPPKLRYGGDDPALIPANGKWKLKNKKLFRPETIRRWIVVCFATRGNFPDGSAREVIRSFIENCNGVGMTVNDINPPIVYANGQGSIRYTLRTAADQVIQKHQEGPDLMMIVLPDGGNDIYLAVKHFGDVEKGVATQCLKVGHCTGKKGDGRYWTNVCLKVNVKLGGINMIPDPQSESVAMLVDPQTPTVVMGADVVHPAPGTDRPSFTAVVGNVDSHIVKYVAQTGVQQSRQEMIDGLQDMCQNILQLYKSYRQHKENQVDPPQRLIFFRDGVSEGQFQHVIDNELPMIKAACLAMRIMPKITLLVVGKRHHVRFVPQDKRDADQKSGNCPAGMVVDREICHPTEFDFYLQSHGGVIGTSRPAHYTVLYDENGFTADTMQALSYALCHISARSTSSVSIPAPVYYADIVCSRAKIHYDPHGALNLSDREIGPYASTDEMLAAFKREYKPTHSAQAKRMYFL